ncbi:BQ2448_936 [Microbotryum intermedium]|uniref:BQ2448_936 protein n=1 Tax=Microbotryum intermedium TaxID=269621 RepID=A0A238F6K4_9BASI|nr:BQ2448_936 [Microbotryum intermedium]
MTYTHQVNMHAIATPHSTSSSPSSLSSSASPRGTRRLSMSSTRLGSSSDERLHLHQQLSTSPSGGTSSPLLASNGRTTAPSFLYLPPGISLARKGCGEEVSQQSVGPHDLASAAPLTSKSRSIDQLGTSSLHPNAASTPPLRTTIGFEPLLVANSSSSSSSTISRKLSSSSSSSASSSCCASTSSTSNGPISSLASSIAASDEISTSPPSSSAKRTSSASRPAVPGEDPQLAAARRALWEDVVPPTKATTSPQSNSGSDDSGSMTPSAQPCPVFDEDDNEDVKDEAQQDSDSEDEPNADAIPPHEPSHATLTPLASCLRSEAPSRTPSTQSLSNGCPSTSFVRISEDPPRAFMTYSAIDYERRGQGPVEKLSIKEWMELQGVREAVGVWSGRITANDWTEEPSPMNGSSNAPGIASKEPSSNGNGLIVAIGKGHPSTANGVRRVASLPNSPMSLTFKDLPTPKRATSGPLLNDKDDEESEPTQPLKPAYHKGVRTVAHNVEPVEAPSSLWDD